MQKVCMTIAGLDPSGGAGIVADIKTFRAFDCFATVAITSITFQNTQGVFGAVHQSAETVRNQILPILDDFEVSAVKTGMLPTAEIITEVGKVAAEYSLKNFVIDPVVRSTSGYDLIDDDALRSLTMDLFPIALIVTPNIPEAERICRIRIQSIEDIKFAGKEILKLGPKSVLIKGGHIPLSKLPDDEVISVDENDTELKALDFLFFNDTLTIFASPYMRTQATHGTGCVLSSAITACIAKGADLRQAVLQAKKFVTNAIKTAPLMGKGYSPINV